MRSVHVRHAALERNRRCVHAYLFNRLELLRRLRWEMGSSVLPEGVRANLHPAELDWFSKYCSYSFCILLLFLLLSHTLCNANQEILLHK